ncbi:MAG: ATPase [Alphaproteobacteria bacterium GWC2_42_16]|nr:MAG: ATPase [Alphaproteobacteria bacterium GWC2_42_16]OFW74168.1 MAG: ATPase [Alphaproteobacteria bacterium GWA2_41_27]OFW84163.1 MAG: ATPase [Alphaproteobacteria bacterium RIFCSPHIGHO2_12_FULL_42_100]OFW84766.1 MAG: ATPase [Alphaproteobacteria bacterium RBG_16_42_14]OFW90892.1 MAG: ATPase [Alphaproteobacteria bacterium RIFCSPHIGHO2_12_42_13]OFW92132.1 MAG: ATPase [Alphaproteobacteria bacterium RIFCSPHIGHO2_02_FULL_42_30]OFX05985.1 MAG: ATPase [Alphaproteobacteria bacterium RIFCSPLOWO2_02_
MIKRHIQPKLKNFIQEYPAVALLGPRQVGKTTLALEIAKNIPSIYLDLESESDRVKLTNPELYLKEHKDKLVILDEVHRLPNIFQTLRGLIDQERRVGKTAGSYLLLGSASMDLLRQLGESLAGRIAYLEMTPFDVLEIEPKLQDTLWVRGGFPNSFLAKDEVKSLNWRRNFIRTYLERDVPQFGSRVAAETLRRFWVMLAHNQSQLLNTAFLARGLGIDGKTISHYLDLLVDLLLVRRLMPWHKNVGKRLIKSPKVMIRDSGITHALLNIRNKEDLLGHPIAGQSWEAFVIEDLLSAVPSGTEANFYRTAAGAEIDLLLTFPGGNCWAIEIKRSLSPKIAKGFYHAQEDTKPDRSFIVYPGDERFPLSEDIEAINLCDLEKELLSY